VTSYFSSFQLISDEGRCDGGGHVSDNHKRSASPSPDAESYKNNRRERIFRPRIHAKGNFDELKAKIMGLKVAEEGELAGSDKERGNGVDGALFHGRVVHHGPETQSNRSKGGHFEEMLKSRRKGKGIIEYEGGGGGGGATIIFRVSAHT
jgi:hypothetical protein